MHRKLTSSDVNGIYSFSVIYNYTTLHQSKSAKVRKNLMNIYANTLPCLFVFTEYPKYDWRRILGFFEYCVQCT